MKTTGYAATDASLPLARYEFNRRDLRDNDVSIDILYCGVCHTDLHVARNDWGVSIYPVVPGHEIVGKVAAVGSAVTRYKAGDAVAVGCIVDSCGKCDQCLRREEQMCREGVTLTYNGHDRITGDITYGGYSTSIVVREEFVLAIPDGLDISRAAPLLCAGITTYSPLRTWNAGPGSRVGVVGLGGLGHMAVKLAVGLGADVTVISRTDAKTADALALGADRVLVSSDDEAMKAAANSFDLIIDTIPVRHDLDPYLPLLDVDSTLVIVGQLGLVDEHSTMPLLTGRRRISGSPIGGIAETQEMLNFCARMDILPDCETIAIQDINAAFERIERADVRYRFVIDMTTLESA
jgi:uncharacterized zinc-type alcohol dehydrogenase-like protein